MAAGVRHLTYRLKVLLWEGRMDTGIQGVPRETKGAEGRGSGDRLGGFVRAGWVLIQGHEGGTRPRDVWRKQRELAVGSGGSVCVAMPGEGEAGTQALVGAGARP